MYTLVRNFILLEITIANAHHSGVLANMTMEEYKKAKKVEDSMVISVKDHKTADTHGLACVVLSSSLFSYLGLYINEMHSQVVDSTSEEYDSNKARVFLSWNGAKLVWPNLHCYQRSMEKGRNARAHHVNFVSQVHSHQCAHAT